MAYAPTAFVKKIVLVLLLASSATLPAQPSPAQPSPAQPDRFSNVVVEVTAVADTRYVLAEAGEFAFSAGPDRHPYPHSKYT